MKHCHLDYLFSIVLFVALLISCKSTDEINNNNSDGQNDKGVLCPDNHHPHSIDMGLSVKWSCCNVGASKPEEFGDYYAWGETETKDYYDPTNYKWNTNYYQSTLGDNDDAACVNWGKSWKMPTGEEFTQLINNCSWEWGAYNDINGYFVKNPKNNNTIFLPAAGSAVGQEYSNVGEIGKYWSSSMMNAHDPWEVWISASGVSIYGLSPCWGHSVRPVLK
ncbi:MAG: hypothetical protein K6E61_05960 [Bacteroidales bacterium]|nr:hypothetical protein [Bacteroidales bacterium]